jgi:ribosome biogenesis GTPase A
MSINWFPGHMHKATKSLKELNNRVDLVYEVVDSRAPLASSNSELCDIFNLKPIIKVMTKKDLADPIILKEWSNYFKHSYAINTLSNKNLKNEFIQKALSIIPKRGTVLKPIRAVIIGLPNVGKSTLINQLSQRKIAKVGDTPAVTRNIQTIKISNKFTLFDSPGVMLKNTGTNETGLKLAAISCIKDTAFDYPDISEFIINQLILKYPDNLNRRYKIDINTLNLNSIYRKILAYHEDQMLDEKSIIKASERIVNDFRKGLLGKVCLENPKDYFELDQ